MYGLLPQSSAVTTSSSFRCYLSIRTGEPSGKGRSFQRHVVKKHCREPGACDVINLLIRILNLSERSHSACWVHRSTLFMFTIRRLQGNKIPLCFWLFLQAAEQPDKSNPLLWDLYKKILDRFIELIPECPSECLWLIAVCSVVMFLLSTMRRVNGLCLYFEGLHKEMILHCGAERWALVWRGMNKERQYHSQLILMRGRQKFAMKI